MYGMVHTLITIMYALNILSRYGNNPGPRHIESLKYLHPYWTPVYFTVPAHERKQGKLEQAWALKGFFVGYSYAKYLQPLNTHV